MSSARQRWFARIMEAGLAERFFEPADVLRHVTPDVLANHLPPDLMGRILQSSLAAGAMTPERVLETVTPEVLAEHIPHHVLWSCVQTAAEKAGVTRAEK